MQNIKTLKFTPGELNEIINLIKSYWSGYTRLLGIKTNRAVRRGLFLFI